MDNLANESDRSQPVFGTSIVASPVLDIRPLDKDPGKWTDEQRAELASVESLCALPSDPQRRVVQHRLNLAAAAERLAHKRYEAERARVSAADSTAVWEEP